jgi:hydrogenase expression/formation protein HypC
MCVGIPARVVRMDESGALRAQCEGREGACVVDMSLTGPLEPGTWVLTFLGAAREVIDAARASDINAALDALEAIARGETGNSLDAFFADLAHREPQLPEHLRAGIAQT